MQAYHFKLLAFNTYYYNKTFIKDGIKFNFTTVYGVYIQKWLFIMKNLVELIFFVFFRQISASMLQCVATCA